MMREFGEFFLYQLVRDSKVLIGGSCSRIKALHDRLDCLVTVKDNFSFIKAKTVNHQIVLHFICVVIIFGLRRRNFF